MRHVGVNPVRFFIFYFILMVFLIMRRMLKYSVGVELGFQLCKKSNQVFLFMELQLAERSLWNLWNELSGMAHFHGGN